MRIPGLNFNAMLATQHKRVTGVVNVAGRVIISHFLRSQFSPPLKTEWVLHACCVAAAKNVFGVTTFSGQLHLWACNNFGSSYSGIGVGVHWVKGKDHTWKCGNQKNYHQDHYKVIPYRINKEASALRKNTTWCRGHIKIWMQCQVKKNASSSLFQTHRCIKLLPKTKWNTRKDTIFCNSFSCP